MSILHSQLAIYGAIDELVLEAREGRKGSTDQAVLTTAANLLPNSTGFGEAGWFRELEDLFNRPGIRAASVERFAFPTLERAIAELRDVPPPRSESDLNQVRDPDGPGGFENQTFYDSAFDPVLARAGYGAFVLVKLAQMAGWERLDETLRTDLEDVLGIAVRSFLPDASEEGVITAKSQITASFETTDSRDGWTALVENAVTVRFAEASKPCFGTVEETDGKYCSTVVTDCSDPKLSVADVEMIVDPINWSLCSKFFCKMLQNRPNRTADRRSRVQEQIGAECGRYRLITDLIFYKARRNDGSIYMNYSIDPQRSDPGYVVVDNGYIYISPTNKAKNPNQKGVRIQTSKQEHVQGLSPSATSALACLMGWADAGKDMLAGTAHRIIDAKKKGLPVPDLKKFYPTKQHDPKEEAM